MGELWRVFGDWLIGTNIVFDSERPHTTAILHRVDRSSEKETNSVFSGPKIQILYQLTEDERRKYASVG